MAFTRAQSPVVNTSNTSGSSIAVTLNGCTAGNHLVVSAHWYHSSGTATISSVTCSGESNLTVHGSANYDGGSAHTAVQGASLANITASGNKTVTINFSTSVDYRGITVTEFAGGDTGAFFDAVANNSGLYGGTLNPSVGVTANNAGDLVFGILGSTYSGVTGTPGGNYTENTDTQGAFAGWMYTEYDLDGGASGSKTVDATMSEYDDWIFTALTFKVSGGGGGGAVEIQVPQGSLTITGRIPLFDITQGDVILNPGVGSMTITTQLPTAVKATEGFSIPHNRIHFTSYAPSVVLGLPVGKDSVGTNGKNHKLTTVWRTQAQKGAGQVTVGIVNDHAKHVERIFEKFRVLSSYSGTISGQVKEGATPVARLLRCYRRSDGQFCGQTTSDSGTGLYSFNGLLPNQEFFVLAFDDDDMVILNAMVLDRILTIDQIGAQVMGIGHAHMAGHQPSVVLLVPDAYKYWRITAIDLQSTDYLQVSEIRIFNDATDITSIPSKSCPFASALSPFDLSLLFDNDIGNQATSYARADVLDVDFEFRFTFPEKGWINGVKQAGNTTNDRHMRGFTLQASADGSTWITRGSVSGLTYPGNFTLSSLYSIP